MGVLNKRCSVLLSILNDQWPLASSLKPKEISTKVSAVPKDFPTDYFFCFSQVFKVRPFCKAFRFLIRFRPRERISGRNDLRQLHQYSALESTLLRMEVRAGTSTLIVEEEEEEYLLFDPAAGATG